MLSQGSISLRDSSVLVLHPDDRNRYVLVDQLQKLGIRVASNWPVIESSLDSVDLLYFDTDRGCDEQLPWPRGAPPLPCVALIGSETPGRIEWAVAQSASAFLLKPIQSTGVYSSLLIACRRFEERVQHAAQIDMLQQRLKARPLVVKAILQMMQGTGMNDDEAFKVLRTESMQNSVSIEEHCLAILSRANTVDSRTVHERKQTL